jgi:anti-sigma regulatory factor (Ser/Thr protein kinase)
LIEQSAQALERARLFDRQRSVATTLQRALLPQALPQLHGIALSSQYRPGGREVDVGGDWYDAFALPGGRVGLVIGDVAGRGAAAAAVMGHVRTTVSALAREGADPGVVLERADHHLQTTYGSGEMVTCCYLVLDAGDGTLRYANAGHLPPVLVWPTDVTLLGGALGPPLGLISDASRSTIQVDVPDGATLVLYTDGLVERRSQSIDNGLARLRAAVHALRRQRFDATTILNLFPDATDDDVAVLVVGIDVPHPLQIEFPARTHELSSVRARLDEWLARLGAAAHERFDIVIAVHEAAANAVVHAYRDRPGYLVTIDARYRAGEVVIAVRDHGEWFARPEDHDGRGLDLINGLVDADVDHGLFGTTVTLRRRLSFASSP